jgi:hypothetical protein
VNVSTWKDQYVVELTEFEEFWLSHRGEPGFPEGMDFVFDWDEQFEAWRSSK